MTAVETIRRVLDSGVLNRNLIFVPDQGASEEQLVAEGAAIGRQLSEQHKSLLRSWNGAILDLITFFGCAPTDSEIPPIRKWQRLLPDTASGDVAIGSSPAGFLFVQTSDASIYSIDSDGGEQKTVATSLDDFVSRFVFGKDADLFAGDDWKQDLDQAGLTG